GPAGQASGEPELVGAGRRRVDEARARGHVAGAAPALRTALRRREAALAHAPAGGHALELEGRLGRLTDREAERGAHRRDSRAQVRERAAKPEGLAADAQSGDFRCGLVAAAGAATAAPGRLREVHD